MGDKMEELSRKSDISLVCAEEFVDRKYIEGFGVTDIKALSPAAMDPSKCRLIHITTLVYTVGENIHDKLVSVFSTLLGRRCTAALIIDAKPQKADLYLGIYAEDNVVMLEMALRRSISGNFDGSQVEEMNPEETNRVLDQINGNPMNHVAALTLVPSVRHEEKDREYIQGLEKLMTSMMGKTYMAVILASVVEPEVMEERKNGLEELYSVLSMQKKVTVQYGANQSEAVTDSVNQGITSSVNRGISRAASHGTNRGTAYSDMDSRGSSFNFFGFGSNRNRTRGNTDNYGVTNTWMDTVSEAMIRSDTVNVGGARTGTRGQSSSLSREFENKGVQNLMQRIETQLKRMEESKMAGFWECSGYFISEDNQTALIAANAYRGLMIGESSGMEASYLFSFKSENSETHKVLDRIRYFHHPEMKTAPISWKSDEIVSSKVVSLSSMLTGFELPVLFHFPEHSVSGVEVLRMADFARNVVHLDSHAKEDEICIGNIYAKGRALEKSPVHIRLNSLSSHTFVTGTTGCGKSNTVYRIMEETFKATSGKVKFMVLEPAKGEYKNHFGKRKDIMIYTTNQQYYHLLKINPFAFPDQVHVLEHLDRLIEVFSACWPLYAAMPAVLKKAFELAYIRSGWDLDNSIYLHPGNKEYPTFALTMECLKEVIRMSDYSKDSKSDYTGALCTRVESLTNGIFGQIFTNSRQAIESRKLFDENVIIDLSRVGSAETKALLMGLLVLQLKEYRMAERKGANLALRHITVMEEAHNLLKRTEGNRSQEGSNIQQQSVEMISNLIAELRSSGEGFLIVDQSPAAVDASAVRNTNTKVLMRLPDVQDCEVSGKSAGLNEEQIAEISKLEKGVAVLRQDDWREAVLCKVGLASGIYCEEDQIVSFEELRTVRGKFCEIMMRQYHTREYSSGPYRAVLNAVKMNRYKDSEMYDMAKRYLEVLRRCEKETERKKLTAEYLYDTLVCEKMFEIYPMPLFSDPKRPPSEFLRIPEEDRMKAAEWKKVLLKSMNVYGLFESETAKEQILQMLLIQRKILTKSTNLHQMIYLMGRRAI